MHLVLLKLMHRRYQEPFAEQTHFGDQFYQQIISSISRMPRVSELRFDAKYFYDTMCVLGSSRYTYGHSIFSGRCTEIPCCLLGTLATSPKKSTGTHSSRMASTSGFLSTPVPRHFQMPISIHRAGGATKTIRIEGLPVELLLRYCSLVRHA